MRVSLDGLVGAGRVVPLKKDRRLSGWFWDHEIGFCQRHLERDRQRQVDHFLRMEQPAARGAVAAPEAEQSVVVTS